jgi:hypothetical protein
VNVRLHAKDHEVLEAFAARKVVEFNKDLGFQNVLVHRDALEIVQALQKEEQC